IPAAVACRALRVSRSWFYKWASGKPGPRARRRDRLKAEVARLFAEHEGKYGAPRITADLREAGWRGSENTAAGLMRGPGRAAPPEEQAQGHDPAGQGPVAGAGPGQAGLPRGHDQLQMVWGRDRDPHR